MLWGMGDLRCFFFGMQDLNSKKEGEKVVCGIGQPPTFTTLLTLAALSLINLVGTFLCPVIPELITNHIDQSQGC